MHTECCRSVGIERPCGIVSSLRFQWSGKDYRSSEEGVGQLVEICPRDNDYLVPIQMTESFLRDIKVLVIQVRKIFEAICLPLDSGFKKMPFLTQWHIATHSYPSKSQHWHTQGNKNLMHYHRKVATPFSWRTHRLSFSRSKTLWESLRERSLKEKSISQLEA